MGRRKKSEEEKSKPVTFSLSPMHFAMIEDLKREKNQKPSDIIQRLIESEHRAIMEEKNV